MDLRQEVGANMRGPCRLGFTRARDCELVSSGSKGLVHNRSVKGTLHGYDERRLQDLCLVEVQTNCRKERRDGFEVIR